MGFNLTGILIKRKNLEGDIHTEKKTHEDEGRDQDEGSASQARPRTARKPPEARQEAWNRFSLPHSPKKESSLPMA